MKKELIFQIGLNLIPKVGPIVAKKLIAYCGVAEEELLFIDQHQL